MRRVAFATEFLFADNDSSSWGLVLIDAHSLKPLHADSKALEILAYPEDSQSIKSVEDFLTSKIQLLIRAPQQAPDSAFVCEFTSGRRTYRCRACCLSLSIGPQAHDNTLMLALLVYRVPHLFLNSRRVARTFGFTERELQTVEFLIQGLTSKEIAERMNISPNTVKAFIRVIMMKTGTSTRSGIVGKILPVASL
jgi:DNA-binding CsgD family transcriptional regulator